MGEIESNIKKLFRIDRKNDDEYNWMWTRSIKQLEGQYIGYGYLILYYSNGKLTVNTTSDGLLAGKNVKEIKGNESNRAPKNFLRSIIKYEFRS